MPTPPSANRSSSSGTPVQEVDVEVLPKDHADPGGPGAGRRQDPLLALLAKLMDSAFVIPGTKIRFGLDPVIGLIPGFGGGASALISLFFLVRSSQQGVPVHILTRMAGNIIANTVIDEIPVIGDIATIFFRSNNRNFELLQKHAGTRRPGTAADRFIIYGLIAAVILILVCTLIGFAFLLRFLWHTLFQ